MVGSGTIDPSLGALYLGYSTNYLWGVQIAATVRIGENVYGYSRGNRTEFSTRRIFVTEFSEPHGLHLAV